MNEGLCDELLLFQLRLSTLRNTWEKIHPPWLQLINLNEKEGTKLLFSLFFNGWSRIVYNCWLEPAQYCRLSEWPCLTSLSVWCHFFFLPSLLMCPIKYEWSIIFNDRFGRPVVFSSGHVLIIRHWCSECLPVYGWLIGHFSTGKGGRGCCCGSFAYRCQDGFKMWTSPGLH